MLPPYQKINRDFYLMFPDPLTHFLRFCKHCKSPSLNQSQGCVMFVVYSVVAQGHINYFTSLMGKYMIVFGFEWQILTLLILIFDIISSTPYLTVFSAKCKLIE